MEFPISFPWSFGDPDLVDLEDIRAAGDAQAELAYERRVDHCAAGLELLLGQFDDAGEGAARRAPRLRAIACALLDAVQDGENALWQVQTERWIDTATGAQLDELGGVVQQPRAGRLDSVFRAFLLGRILAFRSTGAWPDLVAILEALGYDVTLVELEGSYPASAIVRIGDYTANFSGADAAALLEAAKAAGVRLLVEYLTALAAASFTYRAGTPATETDASTGYGRIADSSGGVYASVRASSVEA